MIVIGELHKFKEFELNELKSRFKNIYFIKKCETNATIDEIENILNKIAIKTILLNTNEIPSNIKNYLTSLKEKGLEVCDVSGFMQKYLYKIYIHPATKKINIPAYTPKQYLLKRVIDITVSLPLFILTMPISLYSIYRIKKESPDGGIFFKQKRVGLNNKDFECIKFRSMRTDTQYFNKYTQEGDPRIFPWGNFMRKTRIDELPQLLNVLKGDMHLVGPRAEWNILVKDYENQISCYNLRHKVKPGITGWAQVNYHYGTNIEDTKEKLSYDLYYIQNWSLRLEIATILKTIKVVMLNKGM